MALNLFKKKSEDDFSDLSDFKKEPAPDHMGLPFSGDITETNVRNEQQNSMNDPSLFGQPSMEDNSSFPTQSTDSPGSFRDFKEYSSTSSRNAPPPPQSIQGTESPSKYTDLNKDIQLLNAKMDSVRLVLDSINQRLSRIEKMAEDSKPKEETIRW
jgi:hypothetical protein